jgi:hypothetical protein
LHETEDIVDEQQHIQMFFVAEIFRNSEARQANAKARSRRFRHLPIDQRGARFFGIAGYDYAAFGHFQPQVVAFARSLTDAREHRNAAVLHRDVVNQLHNQNGLADAGATKQTDFAALEIWLNQINDLDSGLEHLQRGRLIFQFWRRAMNRIGLVAVNRTKLIHGLTQNVHHAAQRRAPDWNGNARARVVSLHPADHSLGRLHGHRAHTSFTKVLLHFHGNVQRLGHVVALARNSQRVENRRQMPFFKLNVEHRPDDLHYVPDRFCFLSHALS